MFASLRKRVSSKCLLVVYCGICVIIYFISWSKLRSIPTDSILLGRDDPDAEGERANSMRRTLEPSYHLRLGQEEEGSQAIYNDSLDLSETSVLSTQVNGNINNKINNLPNAVPILPAPVSFKESSHSVFDLESSIDSTSTTSESSPIKEDITDGLEEYDDFHRIISTETTTTHSAMSTKQDGYATQEFDWSISAMPTDDSLSSEIQEDNSVIPFEGFSSSSNTSLLKDISVSPSTTFEETDYATQDFESSVLDTYNTSSSTIFKHDSVLVTEEYEDFNSIPSDFLNPHKSSIPTISSIVPTPIANQSIEINSDVLLKPADRNETEMEVAKYLDYYRNVDADNIINGGDTKTILLWDSLQEEPMDLGSGADVFRNCPVTSCFITDNRQYMPEDKYDAIVFHRTKKNKENGWPKKRDFKQKYIFFSWQTPFDTYFDDKFYDNHKHYFNWTLSYRRDADIHYPYAVVFQESTEYKMPKAKDLKLKQGVVAWYLNKCNTPHAIRLLNYVKRLQKFIPVDIYGKCGNRKCRNCFELIEKRYFFSISFEDIACQDYVSGKLFNNLDINVVPIIEGMSEYQSIVPPHSVIDIKDFESPKMLADYLKKLTRKLSLYLEYFAWKRDFYISNAREYALCQLCKKLHEPAKFSSYEDIKKWYFGVKCFK